MPPADLHFVPLSLRAVAPYRRPPTVAVVGGGAAGIATAYDLTNLGLRVDLFEAAPRLGGNCRRIAVAGRQISVRSGRFRASSR